MKTKTEIVPCPYCKSDVEVDVDWAIRNGRVFCGNCCKSFPIRIGEIPEPPKPTKEEIPPRDDDWSDWGF